MATTSVVEIGRLLASLKFIVNGLTFLLESVPSTKLLRKTRGQVEALIDNLNTQLTNATNTATITFRDNLPVSKADWQAPEMALKLQLGLGSMVESFLRTIAEMMHRILMLGQLVQLDSHAKAPWKETGLEISEDWEAVTDLSYWETKGPEAGAESKKRLQEAYGKIILALLDDSIDEQTYKLDQLNEKLSDQHRLSLATSASSREEKIIRDLDLVRSFAVAAFDVFDEQSGHVCARHEKHAMFLTMESSLEQLKMDHGKYGNVERVSLECFCLNQNSDVGYDGDQTWNSANIEAKMTYMKHSESKQTEDASKSKGKAKIVNFAIPTQSGFGTGLFLRRSVDMVDVDNLCVTISKLYQQELERLPGAIVLNHDQWNLKFITKKVPSHKQGLPENIRSVHELLESGFPSTIAIQQKMNILLSVATSLLYLSDTGWMPKWWTSKDVFINANFEDSSCMKSFLLHQGTRVKEKSSLYDLESPYWKIVVPAIFALGLFMVELALEKPWCDIRQLEMNRNGTSAGVAPSLEVDLAVFNSILSRASDDKLSAKERPFYREGPLYHDALRQCLKCDFGQAVTSLDDKTFRVSFFVHIVQKLKSAMNSLSNRDHEKDTTMSKTVLTLFDDAVAKDGADRLAQNWFMEYSGVLNYVPKRSEDARKRVRIAVFDTGIDHKDDFIRRAWNQGRITYRNFVTGDGDTDTEITKKNLSNVSNIPTDNVGHGTHIAALLLRISKNSDLLVGRITRDGKSWNPAQVVRAIEWATSAKVDILSLSFGFRRREESEELVYEALKKAHHPGRIVVFAAASNNGANHGIAYPADLDEIICIGSSDGDGQKSSFSPGPYSGRRLMTLGEAVSSSWPRHLTREDSPRQHIRSGTSYATPIAAGIAAVILELTKQHPQAESNPNPYLLDKLRSKRGMQAVFQLLLDPKLCSPMKYVKPWQLFDGQRSTDRVFSNIVEILASV